MFSIDQEEIKVERVKIKISTWDKGREFMTEISKELNGTIEVRDEREVITTKEIEIHFQPDDRGFSFISCKIHDNSIMPILNKYISRYKD